MHLCCIKNAVTEYFSSANLIEDSWHFLDFSLRIHMNSQLSLLPKLSVGVSPLCRVVR